MNTPYAGRIARRRLTGPDQIARSAAPLPPMVTYTSPAGLVVEVPAGLTLICFDLDGTLISSYMENEDKDYRVWSVLPHRPEVLEVLQRHGYGIAIVTNQAGVGYGYNTEADFWDKIGAALPALGLPTDTIVAVSFAAPKSRDPYWSDPRLVRRRKPSGLMIAEVMKEVGLGPFNRLDRQRVLMVGNSPEDEGAAADAGVYYLDAAHLFDRAEVEAHEAKLQGELAELDRAFF